MCNVIGGFGGLMIEENESCIIDGIEPGFNKSWLKDSIYTYLNVYLKPMPCFKSNGHTHRYIEQVRKICISVVTLRAKRKITKRESLNLVRYACNCESCIVGEDVKYTTSDGSWQADRYRAQVKISRRTGRCRNSSSVLSRCADRWCICIERCYCCWRKGNLYRTDVALCAALLQQ